ncbi:MAG: hypothetical protein IJY25_03965 [Bacilli bacterium]|nr:hypothetical protein [Bacilli bacterium]
MEIKLDIDNYEKKFSVTNGKVKEEYKFEDVNDLIENLEEYIRLNMLELDCEFQYSLTDGQEFFVPQNGDDYIIIKENGEARQCFTVVTGAEEDMLGPLSNNEVAFEKISLAGHYNLRGWKEDLEDNEMMEDYQSAYDKYKDYCEKNNITLKQLEEDYGWDFPDIFNERKKQELER